MNTCLILILISQSLYVSSGLRIVRPEFCSLEKVTGPCRAYIPSYYYDESAGSCLKFIYGGCRGNKNRFSTLEDCEKQCHPENKCNRPCPMIYAPVCGSDGKTYASQCVLDIASCENGGNIKKDHEGRCEPKCSQICPMNYDPQCGSDGKTYSNSCALKFATCQSNGKITRKNRGECVCSLDKQPGLCLGYFPRYFYNSKSQACEQFIYGGCGGNKNNFETLEACQNKCK